MAVTDLITLLSSIFLLLLGASRGFMRSLLGPFSIIIATILSLMYYQNTKDMIISLVIGLAGPLVLNLFLKFLLKSLTNAADVNAQPNFLSSFAGAFLTLIWGWVFIVLFLIILALLPPWGDPWKAIHNDLTQSRSYAIARPFEDMLFAFSRKNAPAVASTSSPDIKSLADDPRFQKILQDPEVQKEIQDHDFAKLMGNPKIMELTKELMNDPQTLKKVMSVFNSQQPSGLATSK